MSHVCYLVNGENRCSDTALTLLQVLVEEGYLAAESTAVEEGKLPRFVVAMDLQIVPPGEWASSKVDNGSSIDIVGAITGG